MSIHKNNVITGILAGGQSRRFGSDKALAKYKGKKLIDSGGFYLFEDSDGIQSE